MFVDSGNLSNFPDPMGYYAALARTVDLSHVVINKPEIRDTDGSLIHPQAYTAKLHNSMIVAVDILLKL